MENKEIQKVPNWYDEMCIDSWLTNKMYGMGFPRKFIQLVSKFISADYANELQRAYAKGWEQAYNDAKKSDTFKYKYYPKLEAEIDEKNRCLELLINNYNTDSTHHNHASFVALVEALKTLLSFAPDKNELGGSAWDSDFGVAILKAEEALNKIK